MSKARSRKEQPFPLTAVPIMGETEKAYRIEYEGEEIWMPKSQMNNLEITEDEEFLTCDIPEWLAKEKGFV